MAQANQADFLGEGTVDPFAGLAPAEDPSMQEARRRMELQRSATATANINNASDRGGPDYSSMTVAQLRQRRAAGENVTPEMIAAAEKHEKLNHDAMNGAGYRALTYGVLAAPWAITGGAGLAGALGFGEGTGSIAAANAGLAASESAAASAPAITTGGAMTGGTMAAPAAAGGGGAGAAGAAAPAAGMPWGDIAKTAIGVGAPIAINEILGGRTKEQDALIAKQEQLAKEAQVRQGQQQDARMNALGQQLLAFNPTNQMMAQMFGPSAAFTPEQMAGMVQGQAPGQPPPGDPAAQAEYQRRSAEFQQAEDQRRNAMLSGSQALGTGPAPIPMGAPQAARRF